jgi:hypothetical protein
MKPDHVAMKCYCQRCGAPPGKPCVDGKGRPMPRYHLGGYRTIGRLDPPDKMIQKLGTGWPYNNPSVLIDPPAPRAYPSGRLDLWPMRAIP